MASLAIELRDTAVGESVLHVHPCSVLPLGTRHFKSKGDRARQSRTNVLDQHHVPHLQFYITPPRQHVSTIQALVSYNGTAT